jgi:hypothetical protein
MRPLPLLLLLAAGAAPLAAQDARPIAFTQARIVPIAGPVIERGTLVVRNGRIEALGADVSAPPGARIVDASGRTILPGLVSAFSRAGLQRDPTPRAEGAPTGRRGRGAPIDLPANAPSAPSGNRAAAKVAEALYPRQPVFGELLRQGVTSLALSPSGGGFPGLGAVLRPDGTTTASLVRDDAAFAQVVMVRDSATKKLLKETFEKAQKVVDERKKPPEKPAPAAEPAKPADKPAEAKTEPPKGNEPPKPEPKPEPKPDEKKEGPPAAQGQAQAPPARQQPPKDPNLEVLADLLEGKRRAIVQIDSAADFLHWQAVVPDSVAFPRALAMLRHDPGNGTIDVVLEQVKAWKCPVLLPPELTTLPRTRHLVHPAKALHDAGIEIAFTIGESPAAVRALWFRLMELVRCGLPADAALRAVTLTPAKILGIDKRTGSLEVGKDADLLVFVGDPLAPTGELETVWIGGVEVKKEP